jgi:hypothetical protein
LPGLEIPTTAALEEPCTPPPFEKDLIKYEVGAPTTTVLNLLDWDEAEGPSPLSTSKGWVDADANEFIEVKDTVEVGGEIRKITTLGAPMSDDFDVLLYVKGDRKPAFVYNAQLILEYEGETPTEPDEADMRVQNLVTPLKVSGQTVDSRIKDLVVEVCNDASSDVAADGDISLSGTYLTPGIPSESFTATYSALIPGACTSATFVWTAPDQGTSVDWIAEVTVTGDVVDPDLSDNPQESRTLVYPFRK